LVNGKVHPDHEDKMAELKKSVSEKNKEGDEKHYIKIQGRMGKDNPNAQKYKDKPQNWGKYQAISLPDASHGDVYVYKRNLS
jgi:hypothetical protein